MIPSRDEIERATVAWLGDDAGEDLDVETVAALVRTAVAWHGMRDTAEPWSPEDDDVLWGALLELAGDRWLAEGPGGHGGWGRFGRIAIGAALARAES